MESNGLVTSLPLFECLHTLPLMSNLSLIQKERRETMTLVKDAFKRIRVEQRTTAAVKSNIVI